MERTRARFRVSAAGCWILLALVAALVLSARRGDVESLESRADAATQVPGEPRPRPAGSDRHERAVVAAVGDAIHMLETGDLQGFFDYYYPVVPLKWLRERGLVERTIERVEKDPKFARGLIELLRHARKVRPTLDDSQTAAVFEFEVPGQKDIVAKAFEPPVDPESLKLTGFGPDLDVVIEKSIATLEKGEIGTFVERMFPAGELVHVQDAGEREALVAHLKASPETVKQMIADLKAIRDQKPKLDDGGDVAVFMRERGTVEIGQGRFKRKLELRDQTFKLEKVKGSWRLFDNRSRLQDELTRLSKLKPPKMTIEVTFERFGDAWRLSELPQTAELMEAVMRADRKKVKKVFKKEAKE